MGRGPVLILVHGGMLAAQNFMKLAETLSDAFTVYVPTRRSRSLSPADAADYGMRKEVEDLDALLTQTVAENVFELSSGVRLRRSTPVTFTSYK